MVLFAQHCIFKHKYMWRIPLPRIDKLAASKETLWLVGQTIFIVYRLCCMYWELYPLYIIKGTTPAPITNRMKTDCLCKIILYYPWFTNVTACQPLKYQVMLCYVLVLSQNWKIKHSDFCLGIKRFFWFMKSLALLTCQCWYS